MNILTNFQSNCTLQGAARIRLLEMSVSAAVAYAAQCRTADISEMHGNYHELCMPLAMDILSEINERIVIDVDGVHKRIRSLWQGRYQMLNSPHGCSDIEDFHRELKAFGADISGDYTYWVEQFLIHARSVNAVRTTAVN